MCLEIYIVKYFKQWIINFTELRYMYMSIIDYWYEPSILT